MSLPPPTAVLSSLMVSCMAHIIPSFCAFSFHRQKTDWALRCCLDIPTLLTARVARCGRHINNKESNTLSPTAFIPSAYRRLTLSLTASYPPTISPLPSDYQLSYPDDGRSEATPCGRAEPRGVSSAAPAGSGCRRTPQRAVRCRTGRSPHGRYRGSGRA